MARGFATALLGMACCALTACKPSAETSPTPPAEDKRPFKKRTVRIVETSSVPNPATAPYRDCLYTATAEVVAPERFEGQSLQLVLWAFRDRKLADTALLQAGDSATVKLLPYRDVVEIASIQLVDEVSDIEQPLSFAAGCERHSEREFVPPETAPAAEPKLDLEAQFDMLLHMHRKFEQRGIHLVLVPFPFREQVDSSYTFDNPSHTKFVTMRDDLISRLEEAGVDLVDLGDAFQKAASEGRQLYYSSADDHPAAPALDLSAKRVADHLLGSDRATAREPGSLSTRDIAFSRAPQYIARQTLTADGDPIRLDRPSKILVLADSYGEYPENTPLGSIPSANFAARLALHIAPTPRNFVRSSGGSSMPRVLARRPELLEGAETCIFLFSPYYPWVSGALMWQKAEF